MSNTGSTVYPASYDSFDNPTTTTLENQSGYSHAALHSQVQDAIEKIETALGTHPAGTAVYARDNGTVTNLEMIGGTQTSGRFDGGTIVNSIIGTSNTITQGTITANGITADGNNDVTITAGSTKVTRTQVTRQDGTTNSYQANTLIQQGWTFTLSQNTTTTVAKTITFPRVFTSVPSVSVVHSGYKDGSDPSSASDFSQNGGYFPEITVGTASFTVETFSTGGTIPSGRRCGVSWIAVGQG